MTDYQDYDNVIDGLVRFWETRPIPKLEIDLFYDFCCEALRDRLEERTHLEEIGEDLFGDVRM